MTRVVVLDHGSGNLRSAERALAAAGADAVVTSDLDSAREADGLVVPGVGAFAAVAAGLHAVGGDDVVRARVAAGRPVLGICVGMQVLFERGVEHGVTTPGLGLLPGTVDRLDADVVPLMGWTEVHPTAGSQLLGPSAGERFYFVHSYAATDEPPGAAVTWADHGRTRFLAAVEQGPLVATQFHPEKSGAAGIALLRRWVVTL